MQMLAFCRNHRYHSATQSKGPPKREWICRYFIGSDIMFRLTLSASYCQCRSRRWPTSHGIWLQRQCPSRLRREICAWWWTTAILTFKSAHFNVPMPRSKAISNRSFRQFTQASRAKPHTFSTDQNRSRNMVEPSVSSRNIFLPFNTSIKVALRDETLVLRLLSPARLARLSSALLLFQPATRLEKAYR